MQVVILCGGKGTRAYPYTGYIPKPMMPVLGQPILLHVMRTYAAQGHTQFILALGYQKNVIIDYFDRKQLGWDLQLVDTGDESDTGERIFRLRDLLEDRFMATYADGLADVRTDDLLSFHDSHPGMATVTSVQFRCQYGVFESDSGGQVQAFHEKPVLKGHWINAGFFVFDKSVFSEWEGTSLERHVLPNLVKKGELHTYRHDGFFKSMDTYKDQQEIEQLDSAGRLPWSVEPLGVPARV